MNDNKRKVPIGAVLSDEDIKREMKKWPLFLVGGHPVNFDDDEYKRSLQPSCVDLHVGRIYLKKAKTVNEGDTVYLPSGAVAHIESRETVTTPDYIMGFLVPKNTKSEEGLLMLNAGHIDPLWEGFLTAEVINLTAEDSPITVGEPFFSVVFQYVRTPSKQRPRFDPDEKRRARALTRISKRPESLYSSFRDKLLKERATELAMGRLTMVMVIFGSMAALAAGVALAFYLWQLMN